MQDLEEVAQLIEEYRSKIKTFEDKSFYIVIDSQSLLKEFSQRVESIFYKVNQELSYAFMEEYDSVDDALFEIDLILEDIFEDIESLKEMYVALKKSDDEVYIVIRRAIYKILNQIELFFIKLENLILKGGKGELTLVLEADDEIERLNDLLMRTHKNSGFFKGLLIGLGLGWIFGSE